MMNPSKENPISPPLGGRLAEILRLTIMEYIATAKPVSSRILMEKYLQKLSSATIRNLLGNLEEFGYLKQPHPSAGRIPTEEGFRFYLNHLLEIQDINLEEREELKRQFYDEKDPLTSLRQASRFLSLHSHQIGIVTPPRFETTLFKQIQFVRISANKLLALFISKNGFIEERIVHWENTPSQDDLWKMAKYLNEHFSESTLEDIRKRLRSELEKESGQLRSLLFKALSLRELFFNPCSNLEIYIEGYSQLMNQPEFSQNEKMRILFKALEHKQLLLQILDRAQKSSQDSAQIVLGEDLEKEEFSGLSFVTKQYGLGEKPMGTLAVAGPRRMDYCRIVPLINFTAHTLNHLFKN